MSGQTHFKFKFNNKIWYLSQKIFKQIRKMLLFIYTEQNISLLWEEDGGVTYLLVHMGRFCYDPWL